MAILTIEFFSDNWVDATSSKTSFALVGNSLNMSVSSLGDAITIREGDNYLQFDFYDEDSYKWFINQYPGVENEPKSQIPYYWVDETSQHSLFLVAESANSVWGNEELAFLSAVLSLTHDSC